MRCGEHNAGRGLLVEAAATACAVDCLAGAAIAASGHTPEVASHLALFTLEDALARFEERLAEEATRMKAAHAFGGVTWAAPQLFAFIGARVAAMMDPNPEALGGFLSAFEAWYVDYHLKRVAPTEGKPKLGTRRSRRRDAQQWCQKVSREDWQAYVDAWRSVKQQSTHSSDLDMLAGRVARLATAWESHASYPELDVNDDASRKALLLAGILDAFAWAFSAWSGHDLREVADKAYLDFIERWEEGNEVIPSEPSGPELHNAGSSASARLASALVRCVSAEVARWSIPEPDLLVWGSGPTTQRFEIRHHGQVSVAHVRTLLAEDVSEDDFLGPAAASLGLSGTLSALVYDPTSGRVEMHSSWRLPPNPTRSDLSVITLGALGILQAWTADRLSSTLMQVAKFGPAFEAQRHERWADPCLAPMVGVLTGPWHVTEASYQLRSLVERQPPELLMVNGDDKTLVANVPFTTSPGSSALERIGSSALWTLELDTGEQPQLRSVLRLPVELDPEETPLIAAGLNRGEALEDLSFSSTGSWCVSPFDDTEVAHVQFWPASMVLHGLLDEVARNVVSRAAWAANRLTRP